MTVYHIPTVYLIIGILYLILPLVVWVVLFDQNSQNKTWWCVGGELFGIGLLMLGFRAHLPGWVTYTLANGLMWFAILIQVGALRRSLGQSYAASLFTFLVLGALLIFEYFRTVMQDAVMRFSWSALIFTAIFVYTAYLAWRIAVVHKLKSARWLSGVYVVTASIMFIRMERVLYGFAEPDVVAQGVESVLTVVTGLLISIFGNFAFVAMFLERATQMQINATTERVRQEESARLGEQIAQLERQRTLGSMSASFAHELSQPLTAILMDAQAIKTSVAAGDSNSQEILESVEAIENSTYRTVKLVERIRNFIRPSQAEYEYVDLKGLLQDVEQLLSYEIRDQKVEFEFDLDSNECVVLGDRIQLSQIVLNVYRNSIQAMETLAKKKIFVSLERIGGNVVLRVRDTGLGISAQLKGLVGQPFVSSKESGLGVGLSISSAIAEMHRGSLSIANALDGGALVELSLPAAKYEPASA